MEHDFDILVARINRFCTGQIVNWKETNKESVQFYIIMLTCIQSSFVFVETF